MWGSGRTALSVRSAVSLRIQNSRSHIPLCLQFLYTTEGNKGTTVIWLQHHGAPRWREAVVARVAFTTLELCKLLLGKKKTIDFYTYWESNLFSFDCKHEHVLFYAFYSFSTVCTGALLTLKPSLHSRPSAWNAQSEARPRGQRRLPSFIFRKKSKKKSLWNFVFLVLSSPMTLLYNCGGTGGSWRLTWTGKPASHLASLLKKKKKNNSQETQQLWCGFTMFFYLFIAILCCYVNIIKHFYMYTFLFLFF